MYKIGPIQADLVMRGLPDVEQFSPEWEDAVVISPDHAQPADSQRLGWVSLSQDESTLVGVSASSVVGIIQLWDTL